MKKQTAILLTAALCLSMAAPVYAATSITQGSDPKEARTTLTTAKDPTYTVVIPEKAQIAFDVEENSIGSIVYEDGNLEPDAYVTVTLSQKTPLTNTEDSSCTIPYEIRDEKGVFQSVVYNEATQANTATPLTANITKQAWEQAKSGEYTATLTFSISYTDPNETPAQQ